MPRHAGGSQRRGRGGGPHPVRARPRLVTRSMSALRTAAVAGVGVVQLPAMLVADELHSGRLVRLLPDWAPRREVVHAVFPSRRGLLPAVRALVDHLHEQFSALDQD
ncbi:LysR substrate-binding domain-containing protein [Variovorax soli]|uniref:LysR substrate-binding domain-containing protein n=1 Tax=Variovorax soli TaxID=376815 RepID=UPI001FDEF736|nr:LysR substrate-binding domain-containing protein [Variovorax soli]